MATLKFFRYFFFLFACAQKLIIGCFSIIIAYVKTIYHHFTGNYGYNLFIQLKMQDILVRNDIGLSVSTLIKIKLLITKISEN